MRAAEHKIKLAILEAELEAQQTGVEYAKTRLDVQKTELMVKQAELYYWQEKARRELPVGHGHYMEHSGSNY